jgi:RNA polymerase sigma factor (sigma-70 family)
VSAAVPEQKRNGKGTIEVRAPAGDGRDGAGHATGAIMVVSDANSGFYDTPDAELVREARAGDQEAFRALMQGHQARLLRLVGRFVGSREDAEDVVQEAFIAAYRQMGRFRGDASFGTWLGRIAIYKALKVAKRERRATPLEGNPARQSADEPDQAAAIAVREAVARLPERLRLPVLLRFWEGLSGKEIAEMLGWKQSTVWTRLYRGLERLRKDLQGVELA